MNDFLEELARVELSPEEVREVLRRFAAEEFQTSDRATVLDVAEATGATPETVMRVLAELRGKPWEQWKSEIEASIKEHSRRLQALEAMRNAPAPGLSEVKQMASSVDEHARRLKALESIRRSAPEGESDVELYERVLRGRRERHARGAAIAFMVGLVSLGIFFAVTSPGRARYPANEWYPGSIRGGPAGGPMYGYNGQCVWSEEGPDGNPRPVTNRAAADSAKMNLLMTNGKLSCPP